jgi:hypothetical protein
VQLSDVTLHRFENPDELREFDKGRFERIRIGGQSIGRATYAPGWRWSESIGPLVGQRRCVVAHIGFVLSGKAAVSFEDGRVIELAAGTGF